MYVSSFFKLFLFFRTLQVNDHLAQAEFQSLELFKSVINLLVTAFLGMWHETILENFSSLLTPIIIEEAVTIVYGAEVHSAP